MALWKDIVSNWNLEVESTMLEEMLHATADTLVTEENLETLRNYNGTHKELADQLYTAAYTAYLSERSKIICKVLG